MLKDVNYPTKFVLLVKSESSDKHRGCLYVVFLRFKAQDNSFKTSNFLARTFYNVEFSPNILLESPGI